MVLREITGYGAHNDLILIFTSTKVYLADFYIFSSHLIAKARHFHDNKTEKDNFLKQYGYRTDLE